MASSITAEADEHQHTNSDPQSRTPKTDFATLGMFIIDTIHPPHGPTLHDIPGGAGLFAHLGARLLTPPPQSRRLQLILHAGHDFPTPLLQTLKALKTDLVVVETPWRPTTRGENTYDREDTGKRGFRYLTEKRRVVMGDILREGEGEGEGEGVRAVHMICGVGRMKESVLEWREWDSRRGKRHRGVQIGGSEGDGNEAEEKIVIWEPVPDSITPSEHSETLSVLEELGIQVFSPNEEELERYFDTPTNPPIPAGSSITISPAEQKRRIEASVERFLTPGNTTTTTTKLTKTTIIIRAGPLGCYIHPPESSSKHTASDTYRNKPIWLPPYHTSSSDIVDATGAGNAFLGGLSVGWLRHVVEGGRGGGDVVLACAYANVAAGYVVQQVGVPVVEYDGGEEEGERWNGGRVGERLRGYVERVRKEVQGLEGLGRGRGDSVLGIGEF